MHIFVIVVYLLYTIYEADYQLRLAGDFYQDLGVAHDVAEKAVQSRFRRLYDILIPLNLVCAPLTRLQNCPIPSRQSYRSRSIECRGILCAAAAG
jgi:hypothetical protein